MVAVGLYHYYRQGICACPIYIKTVTDTFKVLIVGKVCRRDNRYLTPFFPRYVKIHCI
jgi:hypothetical protein